MIKEIIEVVENSDNGGQELIERLMETCTKHQASPAVLVVVVNYILGYACEDSGFTPMDSVELAAQLNKIK